MKDLYKLIPLALLMCFQMQTGYSQHAFVIGENNEAYHELIADHPISLLEVCNNSMEESYKTWPLVLKEMEDYCLAQGFDIRGSKLWINVFWKADGTMEKIVFHPKPNSKKIDVELLRYHLNNYVHESSPGKESDSNYSHYGSASFPVFYASQIIEK